MPQTVDSEWATEVLAWWIEHADAALSDGRRGREFEFCSSGPKTDELLARENQTRRVIKVVLGSATVASLVRPLGRHNFVELVAWQTLTPEGLSFQHCISAQDGGT